MFSAEDVRAIKAASIAPWRAGEDVAAIEAGRQQAEQPARGPTGVSDRARRDARAVEPPAVVPLAGA